MFPGVMILRPATVRVVYGLGYAEMQWVCGLLSRNEVNLERAPAKTQCRKHAS
jgi:hypothetical protein